MMGRITTCILIFTIALHMTNGIGVKVLHLPEKFIGGVIDMVQSHKNKPSQQTTFQGQNQQQTQQGYGWNQAFQGQIQNQAQYQYGNYGYPQTGSYPQGAGYQQVTGSQAQNQGQYQNYPPNQSNNQFQLQNQQSNGQPNQFQNQMQNGFQGQQTQIQVQNQINAPFNNQNTPSNVNGINKPFEQNQSSGNYGGQQTGSFVNNQQGGNYYGQEGSTNHYVTPNQPQGQMTQSTSFVGQNQESTHYQTGTGTYGGSQFIQTTSGSGTSGPACVCQTYTKPQNVKINNIPSERNEEHTEKPVGN